MSILSASRLLRCGYYKDDEDRVWVYAVTERIDRVKGVQTFSGSDGCSSWFERYIVKGAVNRSLAAVTSTMAPGLWQSREEDGEVDDRLIEEK